MPKAKPFSEDEKTSLDSQWEDEASTTVEQGEVADKIRSLDAQQKHITGVTGTGSGVDEPTVDDQHVSNLETPQIVPPARLSVTAGNDAGIEIEIHPGKTYTVGRGLDNDFVLTDIAVSRKHFDLRNEDGSWIIVDRGSGNGTVVNGNLEDNPFMLANGDVIEIGNTTFRFDHQNGDVSRSRDVAFDDADDEEMSTVAGKPLNQKIADAPLGGDPYSHSVSQRPKTLPPPTPLRPRSPSQAPSYPMATKPTQQAPAQLPPMQMPATTLPMPQMANRAPISGPQSPTILGGDAMQLNHILNNVMPTTIPGQGSPLAPPMLQMQQQQMAPMQLHPMYGGNGYPQATEIPPHSVHAQMLVVQSQNRRGDLSTAHVQPVPYGGGVALGGPMPAARYVAPPAMSKRTKYMIGGAAITLFAAVFTIVIIKSGGKAKAQPVAPKPAITSIKPEPAKVAPQVVPPKQEPPKPTITTPTPPQTTPTPPTQTPQTAQTVTPPKQEPPKQEPLKPTPQPTPTIASRQEPPKPTPQPTPPKQEPPKPQPQQVAQKPKPEPKPQPQQVAQKPKPEPKPKQEPKPKPEPTEKKPKVVATASDDTKPAGGNTDALEQKADGLYQGKKFSDAASVLAQAAKLAGSSSTDGKRLSLKSTRMANFGRAYNNGMAPGGKPGDTFVALRQAATFDQTLGGNYEGEIRDKLTQIAPKAAVAFAATHDYAMAHTAVIEAEHYGSGSNDTVKAVRSKLESEAGQLFAAAMKELSSSPDSAREKFKTIKTIVDSKSQWYQKADKQLNNA